MPNTYTVRVRVNQNPIIERRAPKYRQANMTETVRSTVRLADISRRLSEENFPDRESPASVSTLETIRHSNVQYAIDALLLAELTRVA